MSSSSQNTPNHQSQKEKEIYRHSTTAAPNCLHHRKRSPSKLIVNKTDNKTDNRKKVKIVLGNKKSDIFRKNEELTKNEGISCSNLASSMDIMIKKHRAGNVRSIEQNLRSTMSRIGSQDTQKLRSIKEFNRKCGYPENSKIFIWNSEDDYIRRILLEWGWIQNQAH